MSEAMSKGKSKGKSVTMEIVSGSTESNTIQITTHWLNDLNFLPWAQSIRFLIRGRGKMRYLDHSKKAPSVTDLDYAIWDAENFMVMSWLFNSMDTETRMDCVSG